MFIRSAGNPRRAGFAACLVWLAAAVGSFGAETPFRFTTIGAREGLPNSSVASIVQDSRGFLWFGTQNGLVRWDGYTFKLFENAPFVSDTLVHNQIQTLLLSGDALWIGTYGGLNRFDLRTETFTTYRSDPSDEGSLSADLVIALCEDSAGRLWVGTSRGLDRMTEKGTFVHYRSIPGDPRSLGADLIRSVHEDGRGELWVGTSGGGLARYRPLSDDFDVFRAGPGSTLPSDYVMSISETPSGELWFSFWYGGIARLADPASMRFEHVRLADDRTYFVDARRGDVVLAGSWGGGLFAYHPASGALERHRAEDGPGSIAGDVVYCSLLDEDGVFWIGTNGDGISRTERSDLRYEAYQHSDDPGSLSAGKVTSILEDSRGRLWVGIYSGGLDRRDPGKDSFTHYRRDIRNPRALPDDIVNALFEDSRGDIWVATNGGLCRYVEKTDDFQVFRHDPEDTSSFADLVAYSLAEAPNGDIWVGTYTKGLDRYEHATSRFVHYPPDETDPSKPGDALVYALARGGDGTLWLGMGNGLERYSDGVFTRYRYDPGKPEGLAALTVRSLLMDSRGALWLGTVGGGLQLLPDPESGVFRRYGRAQGLPDNSVRSILEADDGSIWVGTPSGLAIVDADRDAIRGFSVFNDLKDRDFHVGAWKSRDGSLYFGGQGAVYRIYPSPETTAQKPPRLLVSELRIGGNPSRDLTAPSYLESIELPYDGNSFTISIAAADFRDPRRNRFSFYLEGFDKTWSPVSPLRSATYTNLPGGSYIFRVKASDNEGTWNEEALVLRVRVLSPPWLSPPAYVLYLVLLVGLGYLSASTLRSRELKAKVRELTELKSRLEEANDRLSDLSLQDGLTGVANRRRLDAELQRAHASAVRDQRPLSLLMVDLDRFKDFNDRYGHLAGDEALKSVADLLRREVSRASDFVARYGGEEFSVLLPNTAEEGASRVAERVRSQVEDLGIPNEAAGPSAVVTLSVGIATIVPGPDSAPESIVAAADGALYRAKAAGRNRVSF